MHLKVTEVVDHEDGRMGEGAILVKDVLFWSVCLFVIKVVLDVIFQ